ncbi:MAG: hypothetical protein GY899_11215 [Verrucomicrobiaceae bacterium]|nr:hypothetical protein [Verrucomicrobiaceae bacterium]
MGSKKLPFLTAPPEPRKQKVGNESIGILELPVWSSLLMGEIITTEELMADSNVNAPLVLLSQLAEKVALEAGITLVEAFSVMEDASVGIEMDTRGSELKARYIEEVTEISEALHSNGRSRLLSSVTSLIRHRLGRDDWKLQDTKRLSGDLVNELYAFYEQERVRGNPGKGEPTTEEEIKKTQPETSQDGG